MRNYSSHNDYYNLSPPPFPCLTLKRHVNYCLQMLSIWTSLFRCLIKSYPITVHCLTTLVGRMAKLISYISPYAASTEQSPLLSTSSQKRLLKSILVASTKAPRQNTIHHTVFYAFQKESK